MQKTVWVYLISAIIEWILTGLLGHRFLWIHYHSESTFRTMKDA